MIDKEKVREAMEEYKAMVNAGFEIPERQRIVFEIAEPYLAGKLQEEQFFKEKLIRENGYKHMLTLVCRKCGHKQIIIYTGNKNIPCPGCKKRR